VGKLSEDLRIGVLGAAAGLFASSVTLLIARIDSYYDYLSWLQETNYDGFDRGVEPLWWVPASVWHMLVSVAAALLVHRYLKTRLRSTFLLWQLIGIASLLGWALTAFLIVGVECVMRGDLNCLEHIANTAQLGLLAKYISTVFACNVLYGSVMNAASRQYGERFDPVIAAE
jgi:hypothetical protein